MAKIPVYSVYPDNGHSPLGLAAIIAFAKRYKDGVLEQAFDFVPGYVDGPRAVLEKVLTGRPGVILCSDYVWTTVRNFQLSGLLKSGLPGSIVIHGGPDVPKYEDSCRAFFARYPILDIAVRGEGEIVTAELLEQLAAQGLESAARDPSFLSAVPGITFRNGADIVRTGERPQVRTLDAFPSPYLTGHFVPQEVARWKAVVLETNRGCPYGCAFCDWGSLTLSKIRKFDLDQVEAEIAWVAEHKIPIMWIADANFGIFERDVRIAQVIADAARTHGYPKQVILSYAKNATARLATIVSTLCSAGVMAHGIVSIQTRDEDTLTAINRSNISTQRYEELIEVFRSNRLPMSTDLMMGLPGSTPETFKGDLQFFYDRRVGLKVYPTRLLPNSPMAHPDYMAKHKIKIDAENRVVESASFSQADLARMRRISKLYAGMVQARALKYPLLYLQLEHGLRSLDVLDALQERMESDPASVSQIVDSVEEYRENFAAMTVAEWTVFYAQFAAFVAGRYGVDDAAFRIVLQVQAAVVPAPDRPLPAELAMAHDFAAWHAQLGRVRNIEDARAAAPPRLTQFGPGVLHISDPNDLCGANAHFLQDLYDIHIIEWELSSALMPDYLLPVTTQQHALVD
ncbi:MAG: radical SAM protein [Rhizomicrobium sp.]